VQYQLQKTINRWIEGTKIVFALIKSCSQGCGSGPSQIGGSSSNTGAVGRADIAYFKALGIRMTGYVFMMIDRGDFCWL
jgi:hypothetical protein